MRKSRFSEEQKVKMLREAEQSSVATVAKKHGVSIETMYRWRRSFGGMEVTDVKRLKQLGHARRMSSLRVRPLAFARPSR